MHCFIHIDTGWERIEASGASEFPDLGTAQHAAIALGRDALLQQLDRCRVIPPEFFVELEDEGGELISMLSLRRLLFSEALTDRHRRLCEAIPYPCLRLDADLAIVGANPLYLCATRTNRHAIAGLDMFEAFPDNPHDARADGVANLTASLEQVRHSRSPHRMKAPQRYDIRARNGGWLMRYWRPINVPLLDHNGDIDAIIHHVEDVTLN